MDCGGGPGAGNGSEGGFVVGHFAHMNRTGVNQTVGSRCPVFLGCLPHDNSSRPGCGPGAQLTGIRGDPRPLRRSGAEARKINKGHRGEQGEAIKT